MGADAIDGGAGIDIVDYRDKNLAVTVTLNGAGNAIVRVNNANEDTVKNTENVLGGSAGDTLTGDVLSNTPERQCRQRQAQWPRRQRRPARRARQRH